MSFFVQPTSAPVPKTSNVRTISLFLAVILIGMVAAQLFSFETFNTVIAAVIGADSATASILAALIAACEIAALPFLLAMALSPAARALSMVAGWLVTFGWLAVALWENISAGGIPNAGLLGSTVVLPGGWWTAFFGLGLCILSAWASWGMWPFGQRQKR